MSGRGMEKQEFDVNSGEVRVQVTCQIRSENEAHEFVNCVRLYNCCMLVTAVDPNYWEVSLML